MAKHRDASSLDFRKQRLHRDVPRDAGRVPIAAFVLGLRLNDLQAGAGQRVAGVDQNRVLGARGSHALGDVVDVRFIRLAQIGREGDDPDSLFDQPARDGAAIQTA